MADRHRVTKDMVAPIWRARNLRPSWSTSSGCTWIRRSAVVLSVDEKFHADGAALDPAARAAVAAHRRGDRRLVGVDTAGLYWRR